jgi:pyruvate,orthophosphate dikinase
VAKAASPDTERAHRSAKRYIYAWGDGRADGDASMRDLLGGKGAGLAEMANAGLPVPPGFTITTEACVDYFAAGETLPDGLWEDILEAVAELERTTGKRFGDTASPLLVSVRSGAKFSMPGMMDTVLNLGLNPDTRDGLIKLTGNPRFGWDAYRRFIQMFGRIVLDVDGTLFEPILDKAKHERGVAADTDLDAQALQEVADAYLDLVRAKTGRDFPVDSLEQLDLATRAVFASWYGRRAHDYREFNKISHDLGTAVNVVAMVFGNLGADSGTGVAFTRDPNTGEKALYGEYLTNAQGEDVVAGIRTPSPISALRDELPEVYAEFERIADRLERHYRDVQDMEFTIERGRLYMLQTRSAKRTAPAAVRVAVEMVGEGILTREEALGRVEPAQVVQLLLPRFDEAAKAGAADRLLATGLNASPGAATGKAVFEPDRAVEAARSGDPIILVRIETSPDDVHGMLVARGVLTARGGATSHAAVVARSLGLPCVAGVEALDIDYAARTMRVGGNTIREGDTISIDGTTGQVYLGSLATIDPNFAEERFLPALLEWADAVRRLEVWANADYPRDAERARAFGAQGIGLCRTEHMFFEESRLPTVQRMILAALPATDAKRRREAGETLGADDEEAIATFDSALAELEVIQTDDFAGLFRVMDGLPVVIRLIDPPLHEFLPPHDELLVEVTLLRERLSRTDGAAADTAALQARLNEQEEQLAAVDSMREVNPMLGMRGVRLGLMIPDLVRMQTRAILTAAARVAAEGLTPLPEIMIPLVGHHNELRETRATLEAEVKAVTARSGQTVHYQFGTMIEVPRGALTADQIAQDAEFFSFGTNDLTQMTFGYSRDDAEGKFLLRYVERKILPDNPFQVLDREGVGQLVRMATEKGRATRPDITIGICGEHGGDPSSIAFCHEIGLDYVSCSPFRVPVARLAAAQAALAETTDRDR